MGYDIMTARFNRSNSALFQFYGLNLTHYICQIERSINLCPDTFIATNELQGEW